MSHSSGFDTVVGCFPAQSTFLLNKNRLEIKKQTVGFFYSSFRGLGYVASGCDVGGVSMLLCMFSYEPQSHFGVSQNALLSEGVVVICVV